MGDSGFLGSGYWCQVSILNLLLKSGTGPGSTQLTLVVLCQGACRGGTRQPGVQGDHRKEPEEEASLSCQLGRWAHVKWQPM